MYMCFFPSFYSHSTQQPSGSRLYIPVVVIATRAASLSILCPVFPHHLSFPGRRIWILNANQTPNLCFKRKEKTGAAGWMWWGSFQIPSLLFPSSWQDATSQKTKIICFWREVYPKGWIVVFPMLYCMCGSKIPNRDCTGGMGHRWWKYCVCFCSLLVNLWVILWILGTNVAVSELTCIFLI